MELELSKHILFEYNPDTLQYLRKLYNLDKPERLDESIEILVKWLQKQDHLIKKDYSKDFFERSLLSSKGSVERIKTKLDKVATFKTLLPNFYEPFDIRNSKTLQNIFSSLVPTMTKDHDRIYVVKFFGNEYSSLFDIYKYSIMICELLQALDYSNSIINVFDARDCNVVALVKAINFVHFQQCVSIVMEGYKLRIKEFHFITPSKAIDTLVTIFKQVLSPKLAQRIHVHKNVDTLYEYVPKEICPIDLGGDEKSIKELNDNLMDVLTSEEFTKYFNESISAKTNEDYRRVDKFNEQCMDMPGSFRRLTLD